MYQRRSHYVTQGGLRLKFPPASAFDVADITNVYRIASLTYLFLVEKVTLDLHTIFFSEIVHESNVFYLV